MKNIAFKFILLVYILSACNYDGRHGIPKRGQIVIGEETFDLGQSTLTRIRGADNKFQINLYQNSARVRLGQYNKVEVQNQEKKAYFDIRFFAIHSGTKDALSPGTYTMDSPSITNFEFGGAEMLLTDADLRVPVQRYNMQSGTLEVITSSRTSFDLAWKMTFLHESDSTDIRTCSGSYSGSYLYSQL